MKQAERNQRYGLWELSVLCFLRESPMHPYEIQRLLRARHKDIILDLKRGSLYNAIRRLSRSGMIEAVETGRNGLRPQHTTYRLTPLGEAELVRSLREMISSPRHEPSEFMGAVSNLLHLTPEDALVQLESRAQHLEKQIAATDANVQSIVAWVGRINLLEEEYLQAMRQAELAWVRSLANELRAGTFRWNLEEIFQAVRAAKSAAEAKR